MTDKPDKEQSQAMDILQRRNTAWSTDMAEPCILKKYCEMNSGLLNYLSTGGEFDGLVRQILMPIQKFGGFEVVALRIKDGDDYPYYVQNGLSGDFVKAEKHLCERDEKGELVRDRAGNVLLVCMCGKVIRGKTDPEQPFYTEGGSFWTNCTTELSKNFPKKEMPARGRGRCVAEGFESMALIPLRTEKGIVGLLQVSDRRRDRLSPFMIRLLEATAITIGNYYVCKQAEAVLREKETLLRLIMENSPDPIFIKDRQSRIVYGNPALFETWGKTREEMIGKNAVELNGDPAIAGALIENDRAVMASGTSQVMEEVVNTTKYGLRTFLSRKTPCHDSSGGIIGILGIARDITERQLMEAALREKEALLRSITENSPDPIFIKDRQSRIVYGNPALFEVWGKTREEVIGKNDRELYADPAIAEALMEHDRAVMASGTSQVMEEAVQTVKHGLRTYLSTKTPYRDGSGGIIGIVGIARDITERRRMETALRDNEERIRSFLENSGTLAWMKDENGRYVFLSRSFEEHYGVRFEDWQGKTDFELWPRESAEQFREYDRKVLASGRSIEVIERISRPGYGEGWWMISKFLFVDAAGRRFVAGLGIDITAYKRAEDEVLRNQEKLRSLTIELSLIEERERRKLSEYLHDHVGQTLAAAKMNLMSLRSFCADDGFVKTFTRAQDCIEQAIASTRSMTFELSLPILYELGFNAALDWLAEQVLAQGIACTVIDERKQWDLDDGTKVILFKTVRELLMNAVKHSRARNISVALRENRGRIEVVVTDDGTGFAVKAEDGLKGLPGFGLFNIGEQIGHLGGEIRIDSHPGAGTTVSLHCPLRRAERAGTPGDPSGKRGRPA